jgi:hypothetical protein
MRSKDKETRDGTSKGWQQGKTTRSQRQMKDEGELTTAAQRLHTSAKCQQ